jgi:hypothetical protein
MNEHQQLMPSEVCEVQSKSGVTPEPSVQHEALAAVYEAALRVRSASSIDLIDPLNNLTNTQQLYEILRLTILAIACNASPAAQQHTARHPAWNSIGELHSKDLRHWKA